MYTRMIFGFFSKCGIVFKSVIFLNILLHLHVSFIEKNTYAYKIRFVSYLGNLSWGKEFWQ